MISAAEAEQLEFPLQAAFRRQRSHARISVVKHLKLQGRMLHRTDAELNLYRAIFSESKAFAGTLGKKKFDLIISNPPYIESKEIDVLEPEVRDHEPRLALDGGEDGLDFYRIIASEAAAHLKKNGCLMLEIGYNQKDSVKDILKADRGV